MKSQSIIWRALVLASFGLMALGQILLADETKPSTPNGPTPGEVISSLLKGNKLDLPCEYALTKGTKSCQIGLRSCTQVKPELARQITTLDNTMYSSKVKNLPIPNPDKLGFIDIKIWGYYHGKDLSMSGTSFNPMDGTNYPTPICNPVDGETGQMCGQTIKAKLDGNTPKGEIDQSHGGQESAYLRGAWVQALKCYKEQVKNEILKGSLTISAKNRALANDVASLYEAARRVSLKISSEVFVKDYADPELQKNFCEQDNQLQEENRDKKVADLCKTESSSMETDVVKNRMSSCYLRAARQQAETAFANLAAAEVYARADSHYTMIFENGGDYSMFNMYKRMTVVKNSLSDTESCKQKLYKVPPDIQGAKDCSVDKFQKSYDKDVGSNMQQFVSMQFPNSGMCMNPMSGMSAMSGFIPGVK